jgi:hypothetical protein
MIGAPLAVSRELGEDHNAVGQTLLDSRTRPLPLICGFMPRVHIR